MYYFFHLYYFKETDGLLLLFLSFSSFYGIPPIFTIYKFIFIIKHHLKIHQLFHHQLALTFIFTIFYKYYYLEFYLNYCKKLIY